MTYLISTASLRIALACEAFEDALAAIRHLGPGSRVFSEDGVLLAERRAFARLTKIRPGPADRVGQTLLPNAPASILVTAWPRGRAA